MKTTEDKTQNTDHKEAVKYNLTFLQRCELIRLRLIWLLADHRERKTWHEVKKGMEKHEHKFTIPYKVKGVSFMKCEHEGCTECDPVGADIDSLNQKLNDFLLRRNNIIEEHEKLVTSLRSLRNKN
jgi:hypothetical protein